LGGSFEPVFFATVRLNRGTAAPVSLPISPLRRPVDPSSNGIFVWITSTPGRLPRRSMNSFTSAVIAL
jgi:hypothetical protein